jgi:hypothetical protein
MCSQVDTLLISKEIKHRETDFYICYDIFYRIPSLHKLKVKFTLVDAMKAQRESRGIALLVL